MRSRNVAEKAVPQKSVEESRNSARFCPPAERPILKSLTPCPQGPPKTQKVHFVQCFSQEMTGFIRVSLIS